MAKIVKDPIIVQYGNLKDVNQKLKLISDIYVITHGGKIMLNSTVSYIEKICFVNDHHPIDCYDNTIIMPNGLFDFMKTAKKSKLGILETDQMIYLHDGEDVDHSFEIHRLINTSEIMNGADVNYDNIKYKFYTKMSYISDAIGDGFLELAQNVVDDIVAGKLVSFSIGGLVVNLTKAPLATLKSTDSLSVKLLDYVDSDNDKKCYVLFKESSDLMDIYTLIAFLRI